MTKQSKQPREPSLMIPRALLNSPAYRELSYSAKALLIDIGVQFNGSNARDLICTWSHLRERGWSSEATIHKAKADLIAAGILIKVSGEGFGASARNCYTLQWLQVEEESAGAAATLPQCPQPTSEEVA